MLETVLSIFWWGLGQHLMTMISWEFLEWQNKLIIFNLIKESNLESKLFMRKTRHFFHCILLEFKNIIIVLLLLLARNENTYLQT